MIQPASGSQPRYLPILQILTEAWRLLLSQPGAWLKAALLPLVIELAVTYGFLKLYGASLSGLAMGSAAALDPGVLLRFLGMQLCLLIAYVLFAVSWHRFALLGPGERPGALPPVQSRHVRFLLTTIGLSLLIGLIAAVPVFIIALMQIQSILVLIGVAALAVALAVRWQLVFPAIALDRRLTLAGSWQATRGHGLLLFWLLVLAVLPGILAGLLLDRAFGSAQGIFILSGELSLPAALGYLLGGLIGYATLALAVGCASGAYRRLVEER